MSSKDYIYCYQGSALRVAGGTAVIGEKVDPYNPLRLPPFTIRVKLQSGASVPNWCGDSRTLVDAQENVWDITKNSTNWSGLFSYFDPGEGTENFLSVIEVLGANTTGVTNMTGMMVSSTLLTSVPLFDTSYCTSMFNMFRECTSLTTVPLLDTSSCTNMNYMFWYCPNVQSGALALYQQASTQATVPSHNGTFYYCGSNTTTGSAELAQISTDWQ